MYSFGNLIQKRKTQRSLANQRRLKSNGINDSTGTISLAVDKLSRSGGSAGTLSLSGLGGTITACLGSSGAGQIERAWPGDSDLPK